MANNGSQPARALVTFVILLALALSAAACGDSDDDNDEANGAASSTQEDEVRAAYTKYTQTFYSKNPENICNLLSQEAQRAWARSPATSCEQGVKNLFGSGAELIATKPTIANITINGNKATVSTSKNGKPTHPGPLVKENGEWKINTGGSP